MEKTPTVEEIAQVCHEANRAYCLTIGDDSQPAWADAPDWQKESAIEGVRYHQRNPAATPKDSHENWLLQKNQDGWKYGEVKDPEAKTHPCIKPYNELPMYQRAKDHVFRAVARALLDLS